MKRLFVYFMLFVTPAIMVACAKKEEEKKVASTPLTNCLNTSGGCNQGLYAAYADFGFRAYPDQMNSAYWNQMYGYTGTTSGSTGFCGCEQLSGVAAYSNVAGLGCVDPRLIQPVQTMAGYWFLVTSGANQQWVNTPQVSNISTLSTYSTGSCNKPAVQVCFLQHNDPCAQGFSCRPTQTNSPVGICVRN